MNKKIWFCSGLIVGALVWGRLVLAQETVQEPLPSPRISIEEALSLTPEQKEKIAAVMTVYNKEQKQLRAALGKQRDIVEKELGAMNPNRHKVEARAEDISRLQKKMQLQRIDHVFAIRDVLTPEQYKAYLELQKKRSGETTRALSSRKGKASKTRKK